MSNEELDAESYEIVKELTKPKAAQHLVARIIALSRRGVHRFLYENPDIAADEQTETTVDRIIEYVGAACEIIMDYDIAYKDGIDYEKRIVTANRESRPVPFEFGDRRGTDINSNSNPRTTGGNAQNRTTATRRTDSSPKRDSGRASSVSEPSGESKQSKCSKRGKSDGKPKPGNTANKYTDDQP